MSFISFFKTIRKAKELEKHSTHNFDSEKKQSSYNEVHELVKYHSCALKNVQTDINTLEKNILIKTIIDNQYLK